MGTKLQWMPFFPSDFLGSTKVAVMSTEQIGAYLLLLLHAWGDSNCSLPEDDDVLAMLTRLPAVQWAAIKGPILACFHAVPGERRIHNPRLTEIRRKHSQAYEKQVNGGRSRWDEKGRVPQGSLKGASRVPIGSLKEPEPEPEPDSSPKKGKKAPAPVLEAVLIEEGPEQELSTADAFKGIPAQLAVAWLRGRGEPLAKHKAIRKIQAALDVGVSVKDIRKAFAAARGQKIWEILDPLRDAAQSARTDGRRFTPTATVCPNCGGEAEVGGNPCPGCPEGRAKRRATS